jgi:hypothetical protein
MALLASSSLARPDLSLSPSLESRMPAADVPRCRLTVLSGGRRSDQSALWACIAIQAQSKNADVGAALQNASLVGELSIALKIGRVEVLRNVENCARFRKTRLRRSKLGAGQAPMRKWQLIHSVTRARGAIDPGSGVPTKSASGETEYSLLIPPGAGQGLDKARDGQIGGCRAICNRLDDPG